MIPGVATMGGLSRDRELLGCEFCERIFSVSLWLAVCPLSLPQ